MIFLEEPISEFQFSTQADFYLSEPDLPTDLLDVTEVVEIQTLAWSLEKRCQKFSSHNFSPQLLPQLHFPFKDFVEIFSVSQRMHNVLISISSPFWMWTENSWNNRFSVQICTYFLDAITTVNQLLIQPLFSRGYYLKILTLWNPACCGLLAAAGCSWMRKTFWIFCGGDYGGVVAARETSVTVREIDLRVLLVHAAAEVGLIAWVWSRIGQAARHSTPVIGGTGV